MWNGEFTSEVGEVGDLALDKPLRRGMPATHQHTNRPAGCRRSSL